MPKSINKHIHSFASQMQIDFVVFSLLNTIIKHFFGFVQMEITRVFDLFVTISYHLLRSLLNM